METIKVYVELARQVARLAHLQGDARMLHSEVEAYSGAP